LGGYHSNGGLTVDGLEILSAGRPATRLQLDLNEGRQPRSENYLQHLINKLTNKKIHKVLTTEQWILENLRAYDVVSVDSKTVPSTQFRNWEKAFGKLMLLPAYKLSSYCHAVKNALN
jgi:hypothetical protein